MEQKNKTAELIKLLFKDDNGKELVLTPTQLEIFELIFKKKYKRNHIMTFTRFGKSFTVALAVLLRAATYPEKWAIIAPSQKKARIIMGYIIEHIFDSPYFKEKLDYGKDESLERLRRERSKDRINFKHSDGSLGEIYILSADSRTKQNAGDSLMGFGAANVIMDESALIDDNIEAKIFRMLGDKIDNFYLKIGNPFRRNHFLKSYQDKDYHKINADYKIGIKEKRITPEFIDEARKKPHFSVLYENIFPEAESVDERGYSQLITDVELEYSQDIILPQAYYGEKMMGLDVARGGGCYNVWVMRCENYARILEKNKMNSLMDVVGKTITLANEYGIDSKNICVDDTGVGAGVSDRLKEQRFYINAVKVGEKAMDEVKFLNKRAENYWKVKQWLNQGGKLCKLDDWKELLNIKYKANSSGKLQIMPKEEMMKIGIESPDIADALMLTFAVRPFSKVQEAIQEEQEKQDFNKYKMF